MPGHSYKGSSVSNPTAAIFPPTPVLSFGGGSTDFNLTVDKAACAAGRPTFEGYYSSTGTGNPTTNPGSWTAATDDGAHDDSTHYIESWTQVGIWAIGRTRYGMNVSAWCAAAQNPN
jgi:hypothetical protein